VVDTGTSRLRARIDALVVSLQALVVRLLGPILASRGKGLALIAVFAALLALSVPYFLEGKQEFLPSMDDGRVIVSVKSDPGMALEQMDIIEQRLEAVIRDDPRVQGIYTLVGGRIFGRSEYLSSNSSTLYVQLVPVGKRKVSSDGWIGQMNKRLKAMRLSGVTVRMRTQGIRGIITSRGGDDVSVRIQGNDLSELKRLADEVAARLEKVPGLRNVQHSMEDVNEELAIHVDRDRAARLGMSVQQVGEAVRIAMDGAVVSDYLDGDHSIDIRMRLARSDFADIPSLGSMIIDVRDGRPIYLSDVARVSMDVSPSEIMRENQMRIVEVTASLAEGTGLQKVAQVVKQLQDEVRLPQGYTLYDAGVLQGLKEGRSGLQILLGLALFLVLVVLAVQYESLRNPLIILAGVPFAVTGVGFTLWALGLPVSMPVWLGLIMLAGIVVNNAIVLLEYVELIKDRVGDVREALLEAVRLRLRPILMTTLTTIVGMLPLALGLGEGAEMLQPLAVTIVAGLSFSLLVSLFLIPVFYRFVYQLTGRVQA
jgi:multidrug efflux pump subunit AcrB